MMLVGGAYMDWYKISIVSEAYTCVGNYAYFNCIGVRLK